MSVARGFGLNGKSIYTNIAKPMDINLQFAVTPTNGLGITSLKSNGYVRNVFMHTSTTPTANDGYTNPNPANGYALIQFKNNFNYYLNGYAQAQVPTATSTKIDNSALTAGLAYVITIVGNSTLAQWQAIGLPPGITPAVGVSFIAIAVGAGANTSTSRVQLPTTSGVFGVEVVGNPSVSLASSTIATNGGAWLLLQFMGATFTAGAYTPAGTISAPTFTGSAASLTGTNSVPTFTGSALGNHTHDLLLKNAAVSDGATTRVNAGANLLGANTGGDLTITGAGANGGVVNASGGTPAGTISAPIFTAGAYTPAGTNSVPVFTGSAGSLTGTLALGIAAPATGSIISLMFRYDGSSVTIDGL